MWFADVVLSQLFNVVEFWVVELEGLEESFYLALRGRFSNGSHDMLDSMCLKIECESTFVAVVLGSMIGEHLVWNSSIVQGFEHHMLLVYTDVKEEMLALCDLLDIGKIVV